MSGFEPKRHGGPSWGPFLPCHSWRLPAPHRPAARAPATFQTSARVPGSSTPHRPARRSWQLERLPGHSIHGAAADEGRRPAVLQRPGRDAAAATHSCTCEWAANDSPGGVNTSLDVWVTDRPGRPRRLDRRIRARTQDDVSAMSGTRPSTTRAARTSCRTRATSPARSRRGPPPTSPARWTTPVAAIPDAAATRSRRRTARCATKIYGSGAHHAHRSRRRRSSRPMRVLRPHRRGERPAHRRHPGRLLPAPPGPRLHREDDVGLRRHDHLRRHYDRRPDGNVSVLPQRPAGTGYTISHEQEEVSNGGESPRSFSGRTGPAGSRSSASSARASRSPSRRPERRGAVARRLPGEG